MQFVVFILPAYVLRGDVFLQDSIAPFATAEFPSLDFSSKSWLI